jgi:hypothetical protein
MRNAIACVCIQLCKGEPSLSYCNVNFMSSLYVVEVCSFEITADRGSLTMLLNSRSIYITDL